MLNFLMDEKIYWSHSKNSKCHVKLTNGFHSNTYFNFSLLNKFSKFKYYLEQTGLLETINNHISFIDCICGQAYGSIFFANILGFIFDKPVIFAEKKDDSMLVDRFSIYKPKQILLVDDVISTGFTTLKTIKNLSPLIVYPVIFSLISYNNIKTLKLNGILYEIISGLDVKANFYREDNCELCKQGSVVISKPKENWEIIIGEIN